MRICSQMRGDTNNMKKRFVLNKTKIFFMYKKLCFSLNHYNMTLENYLCGIMCSFDSK